jgi:tetratricopeptide (TPR) repeat protein
MRNAAVVRRVFRGSAALAGVCACLACAWAQPCDPDLPFERFSSPQATLECLGTLANQTADPLGQAFWRTVASSEEAVQAGDAAAIGAVRDALAGFAKENAGTFYGARALVHAAGLTNDQQGRPLDAIPMYRQARSLFTDNPQWPFLAEHLAGIEVGIGEAYMTLRTHGQAGKVWEEALQRYPATRAAQRIPARLRQVYERSFSLAEAFPKTLAVYDVVLEHAGESEAKGRLALERLDVVEQAVRAGLVTQERLVDEARAVLQAFPEGANAYVDVSRPRLQVLAGEVGAGDTTAAPE